MFPYHQSDEVVWQFSSIPNQEDRMPQYQVPDQFLTHQILYNDEANTIINKKIMRRDTEKQRRKKMAILNASLRSLLPIEMIKVRIHEPSFSSFICYITLIEFQCSVKTWLCILFFLALHNCCFGGFLGEALGI